MTSIVVVVSDLHIGSTVGLCPNSVNLDDGGTYKASKAQRWLWGRWLMTWDRIRKLKEQYGARLIIIINGDIVDGDHHNTFQLWSRNPDDQVRVATEILDKQVQGAEKVFVVRGTESHVGGSGWMEESVARDLEAVQCNGTGTASWWQLKIEVDGVTFEASHHGTLGTRPWTQANSAINLAAQTIMHYAETNDRPPQVVIRSHRHRFADSGLNYPVRVFYSPAWQLATAYAKRVASQSLADIGALVFVCDDGCYTADPILHKPKRGGYIKA